MGVGPFMLYGLAAVSPLVMDDLGLSPAQFGAISTVTFGSAAVGSLTIAGIAHRTSTRLLLSITSLGSGLGLLVVAAAPLYVWVLVGACICGVAQAASNPATNTFVSRWPVGQRGALTGWKQSGVQMSQLLASIALPTIAVAWGWRAALTIGASVAVVGVITAFTMSAGVETSAMSTARSTPPRAVWALAAYAYALGFGLAATNTYLPLFAHESLGFSLPVAGGTTAVVAGVGIASRIWWGRRHVAPGAIGITLAGLGLGSAVGAALCFAAQWFGAGFLWIGAAVFGSSALAANSVTMVALMEMVPLAAIGSASGLVATGLYLGFASGPLVYGATLSGAGFSWAWTAVGLSFSLAAAIGFLRRKSFHHLASVPRCAPTEQLTRKA